MKSVSCARCRLVSFAEEGAACKRCGASPSAMREAAKPARASRRVAAEKEGGVARPCLHCGRTVRLSRWDDLNGFLVECQHCGGMHGKHWHIKRVMMASFIFNAVSFVFTMRPLYGVTWLAAFVGAAVAGNFFLESLPDMVQVALVSAWALGPMVVNGAALAMHERSLDQSSPDGQMLRA